MDNSGKDNKTGASSSKSVYSTMDSEWAGARQILAAIAPVTGDEFFQSLVKKIAQTMNVNRVFITECVDFPTTRVSMLASWLDDNFIDPIEFDLHLTPCESVIKLGQMSVVPRNLASVYPDAGAHKHESSYIGVPIFDPTRDTVIGHISLFSEEELDDVFLGNKFWLDSVLSMFADRAGAEILRYQYERELRRSEQKFRLIVENQTDLIVTLDSAGLIQFASPSYCKTFNKSSESLTETFFPPLQGQSITMWQGITVAPYEHQFEERILTADGWRTIAWAATAVAENVDDTSVVVVVGRDISRRKKAEDKTRQHLRQLAHVSRLNSMEEMGSTLAHELNQPLASILSYSQACLRIMKSPSKDTYAEIFPALERIASNAERAGNIMRRIRDFVRKEEPKRQPTQVNTLVREVYGLALSEAQKAEIEFSLNLGDIPENIDVDVIQVEQVVLNLVRNSIDAIGQASRTLRIIEIQTRQIGREWIEIIVKDTGGGIAAEVKDSLFDPFTSSKAKGLGLGLSISRSIVEDHSGHLTLQSSPGFVTCFCIALPCCQQFGES